MRLTDLHFLFFFIPVSGEGVATGGDGLVVAVLTNCKVVRREDICIQKGAELPPFETLTNSSSRVGWIGAAAGLQEGEGDLALGGLVMAGRPRER